MDPHESRQRPRRIREQRGFTAIELMVTVAVLGVLFALAAPSFTGLAERWRMRQAADDIAASLALASTEAIRRGGGIVLRRIAPNGTDCPDVPMSNAAQWGCGWIVFIDRNADGEPGDDEPVLRASQASKGVQVLRTSASALVRFDAWGNPSTTIGLGYVVRPRRENATASTAVCVSTGGRIAIRPGASRCLS